MDIVHTVDLGKRYPGTGVWALQDVNLSVAPGEVLGLIGENGAGKTTLLRLILRLMRPSAGTVKFAAGMRVGYVPELPAFWTTLTVGEQLAAAGRAAGLRGRRLAAAVADALQLTNLESKSHTRIAGLSRGMLQRLGIGQAALAEPELLILDEPASGLDPAGQKGIRDLIQALRAAGRTILLSSHYLVELERVCTRVAALHRGRMILDTRLADLIRDSRQRVQIDVDGDAEALLPELAALGLDCQVEGQRATFRNLDDDRYFAMANLLDRHRLRILALGHPGLLLEQTYLELAGRDRE